MKVKVVYDDVKTVCNNISKNSDNLLNQINSLLNILDELYGIWKGEDGIGFYKTSRSVVEQFKVMPEIYQEFVKALDELNNQYKEIDTRCSQLLDSIDEINVNDSSQYIVSDTVDLDIDGYNSDFLTRLSDSSNVEVIDNTDYFVFDNRYNGTGGY